MLSKTLITKNCDHDWLVFFFFHGHNKLPWFYLKLNHNWLGVNSQLFLGFHCTLAFVLLSSIPVIPAHKISQGHSGSQAAPPLGTVPCSQLSPQPCIPLVLPWPHPHVLLQHLPWLDSALPFSRPQEWVVIPIILNILTLNHSHTHLTHTHFKPSLFEPGFK